MHPDGVFRLEEGDVLRDVDSEKGSDVVIVVVKQGENVLVHLGFVLDRSVQEPVCAFEDNGRGEEMVHWSMSGNRDESAHTLPQEP